MFKIELVDDIGEDLPIARIYKNDHGTEEFIIISNKYDNNPLLNDTYYINDELKINPKTCPFCHMLFSNNSSVKRHIKNSCILRKKDKLCNFSSEIRLSNNENIKSQLPNIYLRDIAYICGPQGSGKSYYCKNYINEFIDIFPDKKIFLISRISDDSAFKEFIDNDIIIPLYLDEIRDEIIKNPIDAKKELSNSLCIFDDYDMIDKELQKSLEITLRDIILNCRDQSCSEIDRRDSKDIYVLITSHQIRDYKRTRDILFESSSITIFPKEERYQNKNLLKDNLQYSPSCIRKILNLNSRWVTLYKRSPQYILYDKGCFKPF